MRLLLLAALVLQGQQPKINEEKVYGREAWILS